MGSKLTVAAQVKCLVNGQLFAEVSSMSWTSATPKKAVRGLDSSQPYELAVTSSSCTGQLSLYRITGSGGLEGAGIIPPYQDLPREKYFTLTLIDRLTDSVIFEAHHCSVTSQGWQVAAKSLIVGSMAFEAISWNNEVRPLAAQGG